MKRILVVLAIAIAQIGPTTIWAGEEAQQEDQQSQIAALRKEIAELKAAIAALQQAQKKQVSIGVMPIENAGRIPQVGNAFRQVLVSALREVGIKAYETLDEETLRWIRRQDQLVREGLIDPKTVPPRGYLQGITHYLLGTVTRYSEEDVEDIKVLLEIIVGRTVGGLRTRIGSLVVDFRLVDVESGLVVDSFRTEATVKRKELFGVVVSGGWYRRQESLPEKAARAVAQQAAQRLAKLFSPPQLVKPLPPGPPPKPEKPAPKLE